MDIQTSAYFSQKEDKRIADLDSERKSTQEALRRNEKRKEALVNITETLEGLQEDEGEIVLTRSETHHTTHTVLTRRFAPRQQPQIPKP